MSGIANRYMPNMENEGEPYYEKYAVKEHGFEPNENVINPVQEPKSEVPYYEQYAVKEEPKDERNFIEKAYKKGERLATQAAIGGIQRATAPVDIATLFAKTLAEKTAPQEFRQNIFNEIENLQEEKASGNWDENKQQEYDSYVDLIKHPEKIGAILT